jgi:hypothetical protein
MNTLMTKEEFIYELATLEEITLEEARLIADERERTYVFSGWYEAFVRETAFEWSDCRKVGMTDEEHEEQKRLYVSPWSGSWQLPELPYHRDN